MEQELHVLNKHYTLHKHAHTESVLVTQLAEPTRCTMSTTMLKRDLGTGDLCDNIGLVGISAKWSYVTALPSHHDQAIPILSPLLFMHVGHPFNLLYTCIIVLPLFPGIFSLHRRNGLGTRLIQNMHVRTCMCMLKHMHILMYVRTALSSVLNVQREVLCAISL